MDEDGTDAHSVSQLRGTETRSPSWSPDGRRLAYTEGAWKRGNDTARPDTLVLVTSLRDGSKRRVLRAASGDPYYATYPEWGPCPAEEPSP